MEPESAMHGSAERLRRGGRQASRLLHPTPATAPWLPTARQRASSTGRHFFWSAPCAGLAFIKKLEKANRWGNLVFPQNSAHFNPVMPHRRLRLSPSRANWSHPAAPPDMSHTPVSLRLKCHLQRSYVKRIGTARTKFFCCSGRSYRPLLVFYCNCALATVSFLCL